MAAAIAEFEAQGVDLSNVITSASGGDLSNTPMAMALNNLQESIDASDIPSSLHSLEQIADLLDQSSVDLVQQQQQKTLAATALQLHMPSILLSCLQTSLQKPHDHHLQNESMVNTKKNTPELICNILSLLSSMLVLSSDLRADFLQSQGPQTLHIILESYSKPTIHAPIVIHALHALTSTALKDEEGKLAIMKNGLATQTLNIISSLYSSNQFLNDNGDSNHTTILDHTALHSTSSIVCGGCKLLIALTSADDLSQPTSRYIHFKFPFNERYFLFAL